MDKNKVMKIVGIILGVLLICLISFFASLSVEDDNAGENFAADSAQEIIDRAQRESDAVKENEKKALNEISIDEYLDLYNGSEKSIVLIARPSCGYCEIAEPIIQNLSYKYDFTVNYLNTDALSDEDHTRFIKSDEYFAEGYGTPIVLVLADGKIVDKVAGLTDKDSYKKFFEGHEFIK